jgi:sugar (glycoside-pentoside-hexuronide) transporter
MKQDKVSVLEKIGYGVGDTACSLVFTSVTMFLTFFYTDIFGLTAVEVGVMFLTARTLDAVVDPLIGIIADRTHTRWGHFRPFLLWMAIPYTVSAILTYTTPDFGHTGKLVYAYITYNLLMYLYSAMNIPYCSLGGVITADHKERVSCQSYRFALASIGGLIISSTTLPLVELLGHGNKQAGYQGATMVMGAIALVLFFFCFATTKERLTPVIEKNNSVLSDLKDLWKNDQWRVIALITFFSSSANVMRGAATLYYATYLMTDPTAASTEGVAMKSAFITTGVVGTIIGAIISEPLAKRYSKLTMFNVINYVLVAMGIALFVTPPKLLTVVFPIYFLIGFFHQMNQPFKWSMMADAVDYGEWKLGRRITGLSISGNLFALKLGMAASGAVVGFLLSGLGYQAGVPQQTPAAVTGIVFLLSVGPSISYLAMSLLTRFYKLDDSMLNKIRVDVDARRALSVDNLVNATTSQPQINA